MLIFYKIHKMHTTIDLQITNIYSYTYDCTVVKLSIKLRLLILLTGLSYIQISLHYLKRTRTYVG